VAEALIRKEKRMKEKTLEQRVEELEREVASLRGCGGSQEFAAAEREHRKAVEGWWEKVMRGRAEEAGGI
jgi:hypothetical protein